VMMGNSMSINQGEIWLIQFYPQVGSEMSKKRPAIVVNHNSIGRLPLKVVVPITDWKERYSNYPWILELLPDSLNGLTKASAIDCFQLKNFSDERFIKPIGKVDKQTLESIHETIAKVLNPQYKLCD